MRREDGKVERKGRGRVEWLIRRRRETKKKKRKKKDK